MIESRAKMRLADEYDAAQERGGIATHGGERGNQYRANVPDENVATVSDIALFLLFTDLQCRSSHDCFRLFFFRLLRFFIPASLTLGHRCAPLL
jgi:hypothetical protein